MIPENACLLRLYAKGSDAHRGKAYYRLIVERARAMGMAGASVFQAELSMGKHRVIHDQQSEYNSYDIPLVIEIADAPERIEALLGELGAMSGDIPATIEPVRVLHYAPHAAPTRSEESGESS